MVQLRSLQRTGATCWVAQPLPSAHKPAANVHVAAKRCMKVMFRPSHAMWVTAFREQSPANLQRVHRR
jgi:hypothetical protein